MNKLNQNTYRKCAAAEAKSEYLGTGFIISAEEFVALDDIALQAVSKYPAEYREWLKR